MSNLDELRSKLESGSEKSQFQAIADLGGMGAAGFDVLQKFLLARQQRGGANWVDGRTYEVLLKAKTDGVNEFLSSHLPTGVVPLVSQMGIDYLPLQRLLSQQDFQNADRLTLEKLCELAGPAAVRRKWLYFSEVDGFPVEDLQTLNQLWLVHSEGKFGFSVQRQLWLGANQDWDALWTKIGWRDGKKWTRYPQEFVWDLSAPRGHLPLSNQLRGVQVFSALLNHIAWTG